MSLPAWEAWIENLYMPLSKGHQLGRFPHGKRGLKKNLNKQADEIKKVASRMGSVD